MPSIRFWASCAAGSSWKIFVEFTNAMRCCAHAVEAEARNAAPIRKDRESFHDILNVGY